MRLFALLGLLVVLIVPAYAQNDDTRDSVPYIYYYSGTLNGMVVERADGTDSRLLWRGVVDEDAQLRHGPGWSADGRWLAGIASTDGYILNVDGTSLDMLDDFPMPVRAMLWHPDQNILMAYGIFTTRNNTYDRSSARISTYWLIDVDTQTLMASFNTESSPENGPIIYWFDDGIKFHELTWRGYNRVTMFFDGTVQVDPISMEEFYAPIEGGRRDMNASMLLQYHVYPSFTSRKFFSPDRVDLPFEPPQHTSSAGGYRGWKWHEDAEWLFVGYEFCSAGCAGLIEQVSIYNPVTEHYREISSCGSSHVCVGWLPDQVNVADLPPGQQTSLLASPVAYDYETFFPIAGPFSDHIVLCDGDEQQRTQVVNLETESLVFTLPAGAECRVFEDANEEQSYLYEIIFAVSPDERYYAITDRTEYTTLYMADTGERIATLNITGMQLDFSDDSEYLITVGRRATATWDIQELIANHMD